MRTFLSEETPAQTVSERRKLPRIIIPGGVRSEDDPLLPPIDIRDISIGGIKFQTVKQLEVGTEIMFCFDYYDFYFRITAVVAWSKRTGDGKWEFGGRYKQLSRAQQIIVGAYVKDLHLANSQALRT